MLRSSSGQISHTVDIIRPKLHKPVILAGQISPGMSIYCREIATNRHAIALKHRRNMCDNISACFYAQYYCDIHVIMAWKAEI